MQRSIKIVCFVGLLLAFSLTNLMAAEKADQKDASAKSEQADAEKAKQPEQAPKAEEVKEQKTEKKVVPTYPVDSRKIKVTIKMKSGKNISGVVKHFLISENMVDHIGEPTFTICDGPVVQHEMDEFQLAWDKIKSISFNKKNKENGEKSCYEDSDKSPNRWECLMTNEYVLNSKEKKGKHTVQNRQMFRFVIDTGKNTVNVDSHLGKVKITNERDESRKMAQMEKELNDVFKNSILSITFK